MEQHEHPIEATLVKTYHVQSKEPIMYDIKKFTPRYQNLRFSVVQQHIHSRQLVSKYKTKDF
jgi:hypothetical protein